MKVLFICSGTYVYGEELMSLAAMAGLKDFGHEVHCIANAWHNGDFPKRLDSANIPYGLVRLGKISKTLRYPYVLWTANALLRLPGGLLTTRKLIKNFAPDVVVCTTFEKGSLICGMLDPGSTIYYAHQIDERSRHVRRVLNKHGNNAHFIAVSNSIGDRLKKVQIPAKNISVIHNGIETPVNAATTKRQMNGHLSIGIVGQVREAKGHQDLFEALHRVSDRKIPFQLHVFGHGQPDFIGGLKKQASDGGFESQVTWHGFVKDKKEIFDELDVCVVPTRTEEPFGLVAAEAGIRGIPVVASAVGGLQEIVEDDQTGLFVKPQEPAEIARQLCRLANSEEDRVRLGQNAQQRVRKMFTEEKMVQSIERVIHRQRRGSLSGKRILIVSPQPWHCFRVSKHHYALELAKRGNEVVFLEHPRQDIQDKIEIEQIDTNLRRVTYRPSIPPMLRFHWPWLYNRIVSRTLTKLYQALDFRPDIAWCFDTTLYPDLSCFDAGQSIFHPVDPVVEDRQVQIASKADAVLSVSDKILKSFATVNTLKAKIPHGLASPFIHRAEQSRLISVETDDIIRVGYVGNLLRPQINQDTIVRLIESRPDVEFHFWGQYTPEHLKTPRDFFSSEALQFVDALQSKENVHLPGPTLPDSLASDIQRMDCFLLTYRVDQRDVDGSNSHKILEYLSTGKAVISMPLSEYENSDLLESAGDTTPEAFEQKFHESIRSLRELNHPDRQRSRIAFALKHSYAAHIERIESLLSAPNQ